jgi:signal transduction histidine kinase
MTTLADAAAATTATKPERAEGAMRQVAATGRQAISEMGRVLSALRSDDPDAERHPQPGIAQLDELLAQTRAAGLASRLVVEGRPGNLPGGVQLAVYRIVQESLTNIRKHATGATGAHVRLRYLEGSVDLEITDDGRLDGTRPGRAGDGLVAQGLVGHGLAGPDLVGHGLVGMRERAAMYGGTVDAGPAPGGGWRVHAVLPAEEAKE